MIRRPPRSTLSSSSAASDVYKRQSDRLHLPLLKLAEGFFPYQVSCALLHKIYDYITRLTGRENSKKGSPPLFSFFQRRPPQSQSLPQPFLSQFESGKTCLCNLFRFHPLMICKFLHRLFAFLLRQLPRLQQDLFQGNSANHNQPPFYEELL